MNTASIYFLLLLALLDGFYACRQEIFSSEYNVTSSLASIGGFPAIGYCVEAPILEMRILYYRQAEDFDGRQWKNAVTVDNYCVGDVVLKEIQGLPVMYYLRANNESIAALMFAHATDSPGTFWTTRAFPSESDVEYDLARPIVQLAMVVLVVNSVPGSLPLFASLVIAGDDSFSKISSRRLEKGTSLQLSQFTTDVNLPLVNTVAPLHNGVKSFSLAVINEYPMVAHINSAGALITSKATDKYGDVWSGNVEIIFESDRLVQPILVPIGSAGYGIFAMQTERADPNAEDPNNVYLFLRLGPCSEVNRCEDMILSTSAADGSGVATSLAATSVRSLPTSVVVFQYVWRIGGSEEIWWNSITLDGDRFTYKCEHLVNEGGGDPVGVSHSSLMWAPASSMSVWYASASNSLMFNAADDVFATAVPVECFSEIKQQSDFSKCTAFGATATTDDGMAPSTAPFSAPTTSSVDPNGRSLSPTASLASSSAYTSAVSTKKAVKFATLPPNDSSSPGVFIGIGVFLVLVVIVNAIVCIYWMSRRRSAQSSSGGGRARSASDARRSGGSRGSQNRRTSTRRTSRKRSGSNPTIGPCLPPRHSGMARSSARMSFATLVASSTDTGAGGFGVNSAQYVGARSSSHRSADLKRASGSSDRGVPAYSFGAPLVRMSTNVRVSQPYDLAPANPNANFFSDRYAVAPSRDAQYYAHIDPSAISSLPDATYQAAPHGNMARIGVYADGELLGPLREERNTYDKLRLNEFI